MHARFRTTVLIFSIVVVSIGCLIAYGLPRARAASAAQEPVSTCKSPQPCLIEKNAGTGPGITVGGDRGPGVHASSRESSAVFGETFNPSSVTFNAAAGVFGADVSTDQAGGDAGVMGTTTNGSGVLGATFNNSLMTKTATDAVVGVDEGDGLLNVGVHGIADGTAVLAVSLAPQQPSGQPQYPALAAFCSGGSLAMTADNGFGSPIGDVMSLDCAGDMILKGSVVTAGTPLIKVGAPHAPARAAYAAEQSSLLSRTTANRRSPMGPDTCGSMPPSRRPLTSAKDTACSSRRKDRTPGFT